jgi:hypothetical protein
MNGIMKRKLRKKAGFSQSLHNFTKLDTSAYRERSYAP